MPDLKGILNKEIGGGKQKKYPSKTSINLVYRESHTGQNLIALAMFGAFLVALGFFTKYLVIDQIEKVNQAEAAYQACEQQLATYKEYNKDFSKVQDDYSHYGNGYLNEEETPLQDRQDMLDVINRNVRLDSGISNITIEDNTATVEIESVKLSEVSSVVASLESSDIVSYVGVQTAGTGEDEYIVSASNEEEEPVKGSVRATLTIEFKAAGPVQDTSSTSETESLTEQLAEDKERAEQTGVEQ
ncbi:MAG: hypothetical protein U0L49_09160 [Eubacterium sp.]|nr:hypothetical protein [Eubacterium sp.]